jgi:SAM-dependent methyltransferase
LDPKQIVAQGYDIVGEWYADQASDPVAEDRDRYTSLVVSKLPTGAELLDLGCGAGVPTTRHLAEHFAVTGVDISAEQVARARRNVPAATFVHGDMTKLDFGPATFDAVTAFFSIIHVPRDEHPKLFQDVARWLRPEGLFVAGLGAGSFHAGVEEDWHGAPMFWSSFDSESNKRLVEEAGLDLVSAEEVTGEEDGEPVTFLWIVARKPTGGNR